MGSLLRAALGPKTRASLPAWGYYDNPAIVLPDFLDHPVKESRWKVSIGSETQAFGSGTGDTYSGSLWFR